MKPTTKILPLLVLLALCVFVQPVHAINNMDLTRYGSGGAPGAEWVDGGAWFNGVDDYATKAGFKPLHGLTALSIDAWVKPDSDHPDATKKIIAQYVGGFQYVMIGYEGAPEIYVAWVANGTHQSIITTPAGVYQKGTYAHVLLVWSGSDNDGKLTLYVNDTAYTASSGVIGVSNCSSDLRIGTSAEATPWFKGEIYTAAIYHEKLSSNQASTLDAGGADTLLDTVKYAWLMNEGVGTTFYDEEFWRDTQETNFFADTPTWILAQEPEFTVIVPIFVGNINALISLLGLAMIPASTVYLAMNRHDMDADKVFNVLFLFFLGFALLVGGLIA